MAMENCPFTDDFPIKTTIYSGFSMAMLNNQMVPQLNFSLILGAGSSLTANMEITVLALLEPGTQG